MVRFDSRRAVRLGNWPGRNLATKSTERAANNVAGRNASEDSSRPRKCQCGCRPGALAGKAEPIRKNPARERAKPITIGTDRASGVVSTACQEGSLRQRRELGRRLQAAFHTTDAGPHTLTLEDALSALSRLCLLIYQIDEHTSVTRPPIPDARQRAILEALDVQWPAK